MVPAGWKPLLFLRVGCGCVFLCRRRYVPCVRQELDGLSTPEKIANARPLLPAGADMVEIAGAAHSSFGDYGPQPGDGTPTISDADMTETLTSEVDRFLQTQVAGG